MFRLTINGVPFECPAGTLLLQALQTAGANVPHFATTTASSPTAAAGCVWSKLTARRGRLPVVPPRCTTAWLSHRYAGAAGFAQNQPGPAGKTLPGRGAGSRTATPAASVIRRIRGVAGRSNAATDAPPLQGEVGGWGQTRGKCFAKRPHPTPALSSARPVPGAEAPREEHVRGNVTLGQPVFSDNSHPYLGVDMSRCIHCNRCVRICDEVQGQNVWAVWGGAKPRIWRRPMAIH